MIKLLWLTIRDIGDKRARARAKKAGLLPADQRRAPNNLVEGSAIQGGRQTLEALAYSERITPHLS